MNTGAIAFVALGAAFLGAGLAHEFVWFRRRKGHLVKGVILENVLDGFAESGGPSYAPKVQYFHDGISHEFVSMYGVGTPATIGTTVDVLVSLGCTDAEVLTSRNRLLFTAIPILFGVLFIVAGIGIK